MICSLKVESESPRQINENINESLLKINKRLEDLEKRENVNLQYNQRNYEMPGIPANIPNNQLEKDLCKIYKSAKFLVNENTLYGYNIWLIKRLNHCKIYEQKIR